MRHELIVGCLSADLERLDSLTELPDLLHRVIAAAEPALFLDRLYVVPGRASGAAVLCTLERCSARFHEFAVDVLGEPCPGCARHAALPSNLVLLDRVRRARERRGR